MHGRSHSQFSQVDLVAKLLQFNELTKEIAEYTDFLPHDYTSPETATGQPYLRLSKVVVRVKSNFTQWMIFKLLNRVRGEHAAARQIGVNDPLRRRR